MVFRKCNNLIIRFQQLEKDTYVFTYIIQYKINMNKHKMFIKLIYNNS